MFFLSYGNDFCWSPTNVCNNVSLKSTTIPPALLLDLANQSDAKIIKNPKHAVYIHGIEMVVPSKNWMTNITEHKQAPWMLLLVSLAFLCFLVDIY